MEAELPTLCVLLFLHFGILCAKGTTTFDVTLQKSIILLEKKLINEPYNMCDVDKSMDGSLVGELTLKNMTGTGNKFIKYSNIMSNTRSSIIDVYIACVILNYDSNLLY